MKEHKHYIGILIASIFLVLLNFIPAYDEIKTNILFIIFLLLGIVLGVGKLVDLIFSDDKNDGKKTKQTIGG